MGVGLSFLALLRLHEELNEMFLRRQEALLSLNVDRLWPRGLKKDKARIDRWERDCAPSDALRKWFKHDPKKWTEFCRRYRGELEKSGRMEELRRMAVEALQKNITLLYGVREERYNNALALKEMLEGALS